MAIAVSIFTLSGKSLSIFFANFHLCCADGIHGERILAICVQAEVSRALWLFLLCLAHKTSRIFCRLLSVHARSVRFRPSASEFLLDFGLLLCEQTTDAPDCAIILTHVHNGGSCLCLARTKQSRFFVLIPLSRSQVLFDILCTDPCF